MKVIIAGSRWIYDSVIVAESMWRCGFPIDTVVSGCANGIDSLGIAWAEERAIPVERFPYPSGSGIFGGPMRNKKMAMYADALVLIWDGVSRGSADMLRQAVKHNLPIFEARLVVPMHEFPRWVFSHL
jgi:hypothetical protein